MLELTKQKEKSRPDCTLTEAFSVISQVLISLQIKIIHIQLENILRQNCKMKQALMTSGFPILLSSSTPKRQWKHFSKTKSFF